MARKSSRFTLRRHWVAPLAVRPRPPSDAAKVDLSPGESTQGQIQFARDSLAFWDETTDCWAVEKGVHDIFCWNEFKSERAS
jgi:Fibronectin type III-like domain